MTFSTNRLHFEKRSGDCSVARLTSYPACIDNWVSPSLLGDNV